MAVKKIEESEGKFDAIFCGKQAIDGDTAQVGPQMAEKLGLPQITYVKEFEIADDMKTITVKRALEDGYQILKIKTPCMLTAIKELNTPRYMSIGGIYEATQKEIPTYSAADLGVDPDKEVGLLASPTNVYRSFTPAPKGKGVMIEAETEKEQADKLLVGLKSKFVI